ncbi:MAG: SulP family inorganic anion transporter, partial [Acidimicrobiia bacterium]|nr:SulP family inorganic anion transporter [Acidimicrobiia bacterium]
MATQSEGAASSLSEELSGGQAVPILVGGLLGGFIAASIALSLASLIFSGPMSDGLGVAISASLIGGSVVAIVSGLYGSSPGMISGVQDSIAAVIAAATAVVATTAAPGTEVATAFAAVGLTTIAFGATLWAAGRWRLGRALQFVPYPVILGFIGATGIVIFQGALGVLSPRGAAVLDDLAILVPGLVLGAVMYAITRWSGSKYGVPVLIVGAAAAINLWANLGHGRDAAVEEGWFLGPFAQGQALDLLIMREVVNADWSALGSQIAVLLTAVAVGVIGFLLNAPAVAETTGADIDVDLDLGPTGLANVAAGMIGGLPGFLLLSDSVAVYKIAGLSRLAGVFTGIVGLGVAVAGTSLFSAIPTALVGGVLVFIAFNFLDDALGSSWAAVSRLDYGLITAMTLGVLVFGFGAAIVLGLLGAVLLFVFRYAQITVVNRDLDVMDYPGLVDRSPEERQALESASSRGRILELEGFVFFGTARQIAERVTNMDAAVDYVVVDTSRVKGIDSS